MTYIRPMTQEERERAMERDKINSSQDALRNVNLGVGENVTGRVRYEMEEDTDET